MAESIFDRKARVRPPRVHITYEVETGGAMAMKEIPFVMGVLSDLGGQPKDKPAKLKDRKFVDIDRDNFDDVLKSMKPRLALRVDNTLKDDGSELSVELNFEKLADFRPENVAKQVKPLADLMEVRNQLKDLQGRMEGNDRLEELLGAVMDNDGVRDKLKDVLGAGGASEEAAPAEEASEEPGGDDTGEEA
jgi:type VI secretion system protein ImpB